jgi:hypothetical protein
MNTSEIKAYVESTIIQIKAACDAMNTPYPSQVDFSIVTFDGPSLKFSVPLD